MSPRKPEFVGDGGGGFKKPRKLIVLASAIGVLVVVAVAVFNVCFEYVRPYEYGIKVVKIGVDKGVQEDWHGPGYAFRIPFGVHQIHRLPQNVQVLEMTNYPGTRTSDAYIDKGAKIQTSDGFFVEVDTTILYRIVDPYEVFTKLGPDDQFLQLGMLPKAEAVLKETLGQLTTEEFYDSHKRVEKAEMARDLLNEKLAEEGMEVDQVLVRYFEYSDSIQQNIEDKKLQDQLVFTNESKGRAAEQRQELMRTQEEGKYAVKVKLEEGGAYRVEKEAERDVYTRTKQAEADLLVARAEAEGTRMKSDAMQAAGANAMVAMRMAEILEGLDTIIVPAGGADGINPLDLDRILTLFGVGLEGGQGASPVPVRSAPEAAGPDETTGEEAQ